MTVHAGEIFKLEQDLVCTTTTDGGSDTSVAITVEEGGTLLCDGYSIIQLNDEVGKATNCYQQSVTNCGLAWGAVGVELKSGATVEGCKAISGWLSGLKIAPPAGGYPKEIKIENCGATLNYYGLDIFPQQNLDVIDYSIKDSYFNHNTQGIDTTAYHVGPPAYWTYASSKVHIEGVRAEFNLDTGIGLTLAPEGSEVTMKEVEANYNFDGAVFVAQYVSSESEPLKVILEKTNSFIGNTNVGFWAFTSPDAKLDVFVSKGASLNASNNIGQGGYGVFLLSTSTLTVKNGGAVYACGNQAFDLSGAEGDSNQFFPASGKHYTCDTTEDTDGFECMNTCPVCELN